MLASALLCYAGFMALCLAMEKHFNDLLKCKSTLAQRRCLRVLGTGLLIVSPWPAIASQGWALGLVQWCAVLMASAGLMVWLMPYRPRLAIGLAAACVVAGPVAAMLARLG
ncbi:DUF3325 domain-containing protein [Pseudomonas sp. KNUC1026]|uniref:DUF3325 domain-containing protein n=1 Tax=Pseudomonas sp. KNUC1026 TaxID=2893890 RepID=UPI001F3E7829|nr:DUF3325 domain-containing protein [Pseudomonas sp. KNUC1026]UFH48614.1 DUF3325 domain-containing protein [Pseudomonas sp. KNUC1026]